MNKITEFDVTYCTKEYLLNEKWMIIAYNPPGSQGTFTIPNPHKNPKYRGQTGSISPDIVAYKKIGNENIFLFVEAKPDYNKDDEEKMVQLFKNQEKKDVFIQVVEGVAKANNIPIDFSLPTKYKFAKAHSDNKGDHLSKNVSTIIVNKVDLNWNNKNIDPSIKIYSKFSVTYFE